MPKSAQALTSTRSLADASDAYGMFSFSLKIQKTNFFNCIESGWQTFSIARTSTQEKCNLETRRDGAPTL